jgi:N-acetylated-alpha-linked acidic dipeptidase
LNGHGLSATKDLNQFWSKNLGLGKEGVRYNIGPTPDNIVLNLVNEQNYTITPIWNVIGIINGTIPDEVIVIGNHRDAWIVGGATDPNSGSATLNEVIRALGIAAKKGWKPLRTLVFASWDGEEYGLVGSTEWVEEYLPWLSAANVAYINLDSAVSGTRFAVSSAPLLNNIVIEVAKLVQSPNQTIPGQTVFDLWDGEIHTMGSGSDFTAFQDFAGVPSIDMGFGGERGDPVYHYHSNYDSYHWMSTYGDPGFKYHATVARLLGLFVARLSESPVIPLNTTDYGLALQTYVKKILAKLPKPTDEITSERYNEIKTELRAAAKLFTWTAQEFELWKLDLAYQFDNDIPWWRWWKKLQLIYAIRKVNTQTKLLERQFLYQKGLDGRSWFKHVIFAPGLWTGYAGGEFSFLTALSSYLSILAVCAVIATLKKTEANDHFYSCLPGH